MPSGMHADTLASPMRAKSLLLTLTLLTISEKTVIALVRATVPHTVGAKVSESILPAGKETCVGPSIGNPAPTECEQTDLSLATVSLTRGYKRLLQQ